MTSIRRLASYCLLPPACCLLVIGCMKVQSGVGPQAAAPAPEERVSPSIYDRTEDAQTKLKALEATVGELPGGGSSPLEAEKSHRDLMRDSFARLAEILPLLEGQQTSGEFLNTLRIIEGSRTQLASGSMELAAEPTIDTGLRAVVRALGLVNRDVFGEDADLAKGIDTVRHRVDELDTRRGPLHRVVAGQAMTATTGTVRQMLTALSEKAGARPTPSTRPSTQPTTQPVAGGAAAEAR